MKRKKHFKEHPRNIWTDTWRPGQRWKYEEASLTDLFETRFPMNCICLTQTFPRLILPHKSICQSCRSDSESNCPVKLCYSELTYLLNGPHDSTAGLSHWNNFCLLNLWSGGSASQRKKKTPVTQHRIFPWPASFHKGMSRTVSKGNRGDQ